MTKEELLKKMRRATTEAQIVEAMADVQEYLDANPEDYEVVGQIESLHRKRGGLIGRRERQAAHCC